LLGTIQRITLTTHEDKPMKPIIRKPELCRNLGISPVTLWRWTRREGFPAPIKLGPNSVGWIEAEINEWLAARAAERGAQQNASQVGGV
jgi:prophage regulatory protein